MKGSIILKYEETFVDASFFVRKSYAPYCGAPYIRKKQENEFAGNSTADICSFWGGEISDAESLYIPFIW